jgi:hypothetical protein
MSPHTASLAPEHQSDVTVHIVLDDFGNSGRAYRETAEEAADFNTVVDDLMAGQFNNPIRVIAFNLSEGWFKRVAKEDKPLGGAARRFAEFHLGEAELLRAGIAN